jgi:probable HAF family extracellular repeat protein
MPTGAQRFAVEQLLLVQMKTKHSFGSTKRNNTEKNNNKKEHIYMNTKHRFITIALAACCALGVSSANAQMYNLTDLGVLSGQKESAPAAINQNGQVAGTSGESAFRYSMEGKVPMEDVARHSTKGIHRGFGINGAGLVVGDSTFGKDISRAAVFNNGSTRDLGTLKGGGDFSRANDINAAGQVVGFSSEKPDQAYGRAFIVSLFDRGGMTDLGTLGGSYAQAWGINDSGFVTGNSQIKSDFGATHAFIWGRKGGMLDLGTLAGDFSYGTSINVNNQVVGYSTIDKYNDRVHAFLYDGKEMIDLGSLGGASLESDHSFALGVNAYNQVVGYSYIPSERVPAITPPPQKVAFLYSKGLMVNLNSLIGDAAKNYRLDAAMAINDKGQIAAIAFDNSTGAFHAVLLTPMKEGASAIELERQGAKMQITYAAFSVKGSSLSVQVAYAAGTPGLIPAGLSVYETGSKGKTLIGMLKVKAGFSNFGTTTYFGSFTMKSNPQKITVVDSYGKTADADVKEIE